MSIYTAIKFIAVILLSFPASLVGARRINASKLLSTRLMLKKIGISMRELFGSPRPTEISPFKYSNSLQSYYCMSCSITTKKIHVLNAVEK
jgi:hypothetical protein